MANYNFNTISYDTSLFFPRDTSTFLVKGDQYEPTNEWSGELPAGFTEYKDGLTIDYFLPYENNTASNATLSLYYRSTNSVVHLDPKPILLGNGISAVTNQFPQYSIIRLTYIIHPSLNGGNGCWKVSAAYFDDNVNGTVTSVSGEKGLTGTVTTSGSLKANLVSENLLSNSSVTTQEVANRVYPVALDKNGKLAVNVPWTNVNDNYITQHQTIKQDGVIGAIASHYTVCSTLGSTASKNIILDLGGNSLEVGLRIIVTFTDVNTAQNPTINLNNLGDTPIYFNNTQITTDNLSILSGTIELVLDNISNDRGWRIVGTPIRLTNLVNGSATGSVKGLNASVTGDYAFAFGEASTASGDCSHAEGEESTASGVSSHAEGLQTNASSGASHAEGAYTTASGNYSHAEGYLSTASGTASHAQNYGTVAQCKSQTVLGQFNIADTTGSATTRGTYAVIVGNGTANNARSNALTVDWSGNTEQQGTATIKDMTSLEMMEFIYDI